MDNEHKYAVLDFVNSAVILYKAFIEKFPLMKVLILKTLLYSSGNIGIIVGEQNKILGKYSVYSTSEGFKIKGGIEDDINVCYTISQNVMAEVVQRKNELLSKPWKLFKYLKLLLKNVSFSDKAFYTNTLKGKKTLLRPSVESDMLYLYSWYNDMELNRLAGWSNSKATIENLRYNYSKSFGSDPMNLIIDNENGKPIGTIQLYDFNEIDKHCKLGIRIGDKEYWGKGYGEDAINAILEYTFKKLDLNRVTLCVYEYNERAAKCYVKCGFVFEGRYRKSACIDGKFYDEIIMGILKSEYISKHNA